MKELRFPLLTKDDIELRIGQMSKDGTKASLLLYQDARCGMKYLDLVVGPMNWQKKYYEVRGLVICSLGINVNYDDPSKEPQFIWKDDTGTAGSIEEEKSIISDSFKRCVVCYGLARELYSAPTIWVKVESKYDKFNVVSISYNENREIKTLEIANEKGEIVYSYGAKTKVSQTAQKPTQNEIKENDPIREEDKTLILDYVGSLGQEDYDSFFNWMLNKFKTRSVSSLTASQGVIIANIVKGRKK